MKLLVTLGMPHRSQAGRDLSTAYAKGAIAIVDWEAKQLARCVEYVPPDEIRHPDGTVVLSFGSFKDGYFYTASPVEVVRYRLPHLTCERVLTHPTFNDLHHVVALEDKLLVCNTGLEILQSFDYRGNLLETFNAASTPTWERFATSIDYRLELTTKPHERHINFIFRYEDKTWVTCFHSEDALCVSDPSDVMRVGVGNPHDGLVIGDEVYFTTTNGHIAIVDGPSRLLKRAIDLNAAARPPGDANLGWCRGIDVVDGFAYVGFSQLRATRSREFVRWVTHWSVARRPGRIEKIDLASGQLVDSFVFDIANGVAIFSVSCLPDDFA